MFIWIIAFLSGVAGLAYEVLWYREFALLLGNTAQAASLVLAAIFGGLALGNVLAGRLTRRLARPLVGYALLELGMAICGGGALILKGEGGHLLLPSLFFFLSLMAILMGGTLPFLIQAVQEKGRFLAKEAPFLYGINTAGAMLGAAITGFFLPLILGVSGTFLALIVTNLVLAGTTAWLGRNQQIDTTKIKEQTLNNRKESLQAIPLRMLFIPALLSGVGTLALEVFWTRMFSLVFQNSVYSFSLILTFILLALAIGAVWTGKLVRKGRDPFSLIWGSLLIVAIWVPVGAWIFFQTSGLRFLLREAGPLGYVTNIVLFTGGLLLPAMIPAGMVLPLCWIIDKRSTATNGWRMGSILSINTLGGILGALGAGFVLMPQAGLWSGLGLIALSYAIGAAIMMPKRKKGTGSFRLATSTGILLPLLLIWSSLPTQHLKEGETLLYLKQGAEAQVAVVKDKTGGRLLKVNNTYNLGNSASAVEERRMGEIPLLLHPNPKNVAFVGVATGITASAVYDHDVEAVTLIELLPEVLEAASWFEEENRGILKDPRWTVVVADGRIALPESETLLDVVISDLFVPWHAGTGALYSLEYYKEAASHMAADGLYAQWLPLYQTSLEEFQIIAKTFLEAFPYVSVWRDNFSPKYPVVGLIGSKSPINIDRKHLAEKLAGFERQEMGADPYFVSPEDFLLLYAGDEAALKPFLGDGPRNTDDRPLIEYLAPISHIQKKQFVGLELAESFLQISENEQNWKQFAEAGAYLYHATVALTQMAYDDRVRYLEKASKSVKGSQIVDRLAMAVKLDKILLNEKGQWEAH
ncbi:MAG: fused MFS/spermidine synthase [Nitrospiria bacterium]